MGSPLDDLRNISRQVEKKRSETAKELAVKKQAAKKELARVTREKRVERELEEAHAVERSAKLKILALAGGFIIVAVLVFSIVYILFFSAGQQEKNVYLVSDGFSGISPASPQFQQVSAFVSSLISGMKQEDFDFPWYHAVPEKRRERCISIFREKIGAGLKIDHITMDNNTDCYHVYLKGPEDDSVVMNLIEDDSGNLEVTRIY